jgi:hypothetical protein
MIIRSFIVAALGLLCASAIWASGSRRWEPACAVSYDAEDISIVHCHGHDGLALAGMMLVPKELH